METFIIEDGYTRPAYFAAVPLLHPELRFTFRPMLYEEREVIAESLQRQTIGEANKTVVAAIESRVKTWDAKSKGEPLPPKADVIRRLHPRLIDRLYGVIIGREGGDQDPKQPAANYSADAEAALKAAIEGTSVAQAQEDTDTKN